MQKSPTKDTYNYTWLDSSTYDPVVCVTWLIHIGLFCKRALQKRPITIRDMTHPHMPQSYVWHECQIISLCDYVITQKKIALAMSHTCMWITHECAVSRVNVPCHAWMCRVTRECAVSRMNVPCHTWMCRVAHECAVSHVNVPCHTWMCRVTRECAVSHMNVPCHTW